MSEWSAPEFESKICPPEKLAERLAALPRPLVFTNGCFDILHRGHVTYLAQARFGRCGFGIGVEYRCFGAPSGQRGRPPD